MSKNLEICRLLDLYGALLTEKQFDIMDFYYNDDLSLGEIADHYEISRQNSSAETRSPLTSSWRSTHSTSATLTVRSVR